MKKTKTADVVRAGNQTDGFVKLVATRNYRAWIADLRKRYRATL